VIKKYVLKQSYNEIAPLQNLLKIGRVLRYRTDTTKNHYKTVKNKTQMSL